MRYEEDEVFPDDLFYSFYYYSWQAVLAYRESCNCSKRMRRDIPLRRARVAAS